MITGLWADLVRFAAVACLTLVFGAVLVVTRLYFRAWRRLPREVALLPRNVVLLTVTYETFVGCLILGLLDGVGKPASWRVAVYAGAAVVALVTFASVIRDPQWRIKFSSRTRVVSATTAVQADTVTVDPPADPTIEPPQ